MDFDQQQQQQAFAGQQHQAFAGQQPYPSAPPQLPPQQVCPPQQQSVQQQPMVQQQLCPHLQQQAPMCTTNISPSHQQFSQQPQQTFQQQAQQTFQQLPPQIQQQHYHNNVPLLVQDDYVGQQYQVGQQLQYQVQPRNCGSQCCHVTPAGPPCCAMFWPCSASCLVWNYDGGCSGSFSMQLIAMLLWLGSNCLVWYIFTFLHYELYEGWDNTLRQIFLLCHAGAWIGVVMGWINVYCCWSPKVNYRARTIFLGQPQMVVAEQPQVVITSTGRQPQPMAGIISVAAGGGETEDDVVYEMQDAA